MIIFYSFFYFIFFYLYSFSIFLFPFKKNRLSLLESNRAGQIQRQEDVSSQLIKQKPFLVVEYQRKPLNKKADQSIKVNMRHLEIIYNPTIIQGILSFLTAHSKDNESFDALIEVAGDTIEGFKQQTRAGLEYVLETHSTLDLDVDIDAPIIVIPERYVYTYRLYAIVKKES